ncbi:MAG: flagellar hook-associated protein FlgK [bacterium]|nr:flagellar hook-associated protein FlgK [bacterium]
MASLFDAISMAKRSLIAQQWAMTTTGHNIANANTPGYTRQRAELSAFQPALEIPGGFIGMGVNVDEITRLRNRYIDRQVLEEQQNQSFLSFEDGALSQVETILGETSGYGISGVLDEFWSAWSDLSNDPENSSARVALQQKGSELCQGLNNKYDDLQNMQKELDGQLSGFVGQINQKTSQIAALNQTISDQISQGMTPNDLMDQRDTLIDELSGLVNVTVQDESDGTISVRVGGEILVYRDSAQQLQLKDIPGTAGKFHSVIWSANGNEVSFQSGQVAALLLVRDQTIPELMSGLDQFALGLVSNINSIHSAGYGLDGSTGINFFSINSTGAADIALSTEVAQDAGNIAASADGSPGNGDIALQIFNLQNSLVMSQGTQSLNGYYAGLAADVGALKQTSENELAQSEVTLQQLSNWKASAESVSLDEEMANLVKFQQAYTAVAKFLATTDEMLTTLLNLE